WMNMRGGREAVEENAARGRHVVAAVGDRYKPLIADEPMDAIPGNLAAIGVGREQFIKLLWARSAGEADRNAPRIFRDPRQQKLGRRLGEHRRIGNRNDLAGMGGCHRQVSLRQLRPSRASSSS